MADVLSGGAGSYNVPIAQIIAAGKVVLRTSFDHARIVSPFPVRVSFDRGGPVQVGGNKNTSISTEGSDGTFAPSVIVHRSCSQIVLELAPGFDTLAEISAYANPEGTVGANTQIHGVCTIDTWSGDVEAIPLDIDRLPSHCYMFGSPWAAGVAANPILVDKQRSLYTIGTHQPREMWVKSFFAYRRDDALNFTPRGSVNVFVVYMTDTFSGIARERLFTGAGPGQGGVLSATLQPMGQGVYFPANNLHIPMDSYFVNDGGGGGGIPALLWDFEGSSEAVATTLIYGMNVHYRL